MTKGTQHTTRIAFSFVERKKTCSLSKTDPYWLDLICVSLKVHELRQLSVFDIRKTYKTEKLKTRKTRKNFRPNRSR